jgi:hypothetical protein
MLAVCVLAACLAAEAPLTSGGAEAAQVAAILVGLGRGDPGPLLAAPPAVLAAPVAWPDPDQAGLERRWSELLPQALARLSPEAGARALAALPPPRDLASALDRLPALAAVAVVRAAADRAFDRGQAEDFLHLAARIGLRDARTPVARTAAGWADPDGLPAPGPVAPAVAWTAREPRDVGGWAVIPGWLLRKDPAGRVAWQFRLPQRARTVVGAGAAVVAAGTAAWVIDVAGAVRALPPLPMGATPVAVAGGAAWFLTTGTAVPAWRLELASGAWAAIPLPEPALAAPLVRGADAWWLGRRAIHHSRGGVVRARLDHGLAVDRRWRWDTTRAGLLDPETWRLHLVPGWSDASDARDQALACLAAHRPADAAAAAARAPEATADLAVRIGLALGRPATELAPLAVSHRDRLLLAWLQGGALPLSADGGPLSTDPADLLWTDPASWNHRVRAEALNQRHELPQWSDLVAGLVEQAPMPAPAAPMPGLRRGEDRLTITTPAWSVSWDAWDSVAAPVVSVAVRGAAVLVVEGEARCTVLDAVTGGRLWQGTARLAAADPGQAAWVPRLAVWAQAGPPGLGRHLDVLGPGGDRRVPSRSAPIRWIAALADALVICHQDGTAIRWPGLEPIALPSGLTAAADVVATPAGLATGDSLWPWRRVR